MLNGDSKRFWKSDTAENKQNRITNLTIINYNYAESTGLDIHPKYAEILEWSVKNKQKHLFLKSFPSTL